MRIQPCFIKYVVEVYSIIVGPTTDPPVEHGCLSEGKMSGQAWEGCGEVGEVGGRGSSVEER